MGLVNIVHEIDPGALQRVVEDFRPPAAIGPERVRSALARAGKTRPEDAGLDLWEELEDFDEETQRNRLVLVASSAQHWDLDKSVDRPGGGFWALFRLVPALAPVAQLFRPQLDAAVLPVAFRTSEGLVGLSDRERVAAAAAAFEPYAEAESRARIASIRVPLLRRWLGGTAFLKAWSEDDYLWENWRRLGEAIAQVHAHGHWLGLEHG